MSASAAQVAQGRVLAVMVAPGVGEVRDQGTGQRLAVRTSES